MATTFPVIGARAELETDQYERNVRDLIAGANRVDTALDALVDAAQGAQSAINRIRGDVTMEVDVDDSELTAAKRKRDDLGGSETVDVRVDESDIREALDMLNDIQNIQIITIAVDVVTTGLSTITGGVGGIIDTIGDQERAMNVFEARTGQRIEGIGEAIENTFNNAFGESRTQIAETMAIFTTFGLTSVSEIEAATQAAHTLADTFGEDLNAVILAAGNLVTSGMAADFEEAFNIIAYGFQNGANRAGDFLDTLTEYSGVLAQVGFTGTELVDTLVQGLADGARNTDVIADQMKEASFALTTGLSEGFTDIQQEAIGELDLGGVVDEMRETGVVMADEFTEAFMNRAREGLASGEFDMAQVMAWWTAFGGSIGEDAGIAVMLNMGDAINENPPDISGMTDAIGAIIYDDLTTAWTEFTRTANTVLVEALDSAFDITGLLERARGAMVSFADEIQSGNTFGGALEVALQIPGLEGFINDLSIAFNNLIIGMFEVAREIMRAMGQDISGIEEHIARLGAEQFEFEIFTAETTDDVEAALRNAVNRGVPVDEISRGISEAVTARVEMGDVGMAQAIIDSLADVEVPVTMIPEIAEGMEGVWDPLGVVGGVTIPLNAAMEITGQETIVAEAQEAVDAATQGVHDRFNEALERGMSVQAINIARESGIPALMEAADNIEYMMDRAESMNRVMWESGTGLEAYTEAAKTTRDEIERGATGFDNQATFAAKAAAATQLAGDAAQRTQNFYAGLEAQLAGSLGAWDAYNKKAQDALTILGALAGLTLPSVADVQAAAAAVSAAGATTNNTTNFSVTNNNQSGAELVATNTSGLRGRG